MGSAGGTWTDHGRRPTLLPFVYNPPAGIHSPRDRSLGPLQGMTADWGYLDRDLLRRISNRIINEVREINRACC